MSGGSYKYLSFDYLHLVISSSFHLSSLDIEFIKMVHSAPAIVFGTAGISSLDTETAKGIVSVLEKHNVKELDTAYVYVRYSKLQQILQLANPCDRLTVK
jgi:hypothetical protein